MKDKREKEDIRKLKKNKEYEEIYQKYGRKKYLSSIPRKYKKSELKKLKKEQHYEEIFLKYGEKEYKQILDDAKYDDIKINKGKVSATLWKIKQKIKHGFAYLGLSLGLVASAATVLISGGLQLKRMENAQEYEKEIDEYNGNTQKYAEEIKDLKLSDLQNIMLVVSDMWENIKGYGAPQKDIIGFWELDLATEEGQGVCKNMASDVAKKLNAINEDYNARTTWVYMNHDIDTYEMADVDIKNLETEESPEENDDNGININKEYIIGNHAVTLVDIPEDNIILVVDPTNPSIGIYKDGSIKMFNPGGENFIESRGFGNAFFNANSNVLETTKDYIESYKSSVLSDEQLERKYGLDAQNESLKIAKEKREKQLSKSDFNTYIKVDIPLEKQKEISSEFQNTDSRSKENNNEERI